MGWSVIVIVVTLMSMFASIVAMSVWADRAYIHVAREYDDQVARAIVAPVSTSASEPAGEDAR